MDSRDRHLQVENVWMKNKTIPATRFVETSIGHQIPLRAKHPSYGHNYTNTGTIIFIDFSVPVPEASSENFGSHSLELWSSAFHDATHKSNVYRLRANPRQSYLHVDLDPRLERRGENTCMYVCTYHICIMYICICIHQWGGYTWRDKHQLQICFMSLLILLD